MSVFDGPGPEETRDVRDVRLPWWILPPEEVGVFVEARRTLGRTADSAVVLTDVVAYSRGFMLGVDVLRRRGDAIDALATVYDLLAGRAVEDTLLKAVVEFADGRGAANTDLAGVENGGARFDAPAEGEVRVEEHGGGGSGVQRRIEWWVTPLPPPGPVLLSIEWRPLGTQPVTTQLVAEPIIAAGKRSEPLWRAAE